MYIYIPSQYSEYCAHNKSHNEGDVLDGMDLHSSCVWIQTEVVREVEAEETAQVEHLCNIYKQLQIMHKVFLHNIYCTYNNIIVLHIQCIFYYSRIYV